MLALGTSMCLYAAYSMYLHGNASKESNAISHPLPMLDSMALLEKVCKSMATHGMDETYLMYFA